MREEVLPTTANAIPRLRRGRGTETNLFSLTRMMLRLTCERGMKRALAGGAKARGARPLGRLVKCRKYKRQAMAHLSTLFPCAVVRQLHRLTLASLAGTHGKSVDGKQDFLRRTFTTGYPRAITVLASVTIVYILSRYISAIEIQHSFSCNDIV